MDTICDRGSGSCHRVLWMQQQPFDNSTVATEERDSGPRDTGPPLAPVKVGEKWGYINSTGKYLIASRFNDASRFYEGLAAVEISDTWGFIDTSGKLVINPQFDSPPNFSEGLAGVDSHGKCGYIDKTGRFVIEPQFVICEDFSGGLAEVTIAMSDRQPDGRTAYGGFIDRSGRIMTEQRFGNLWSFHEDLAAVQEGLWGFINRRGKYQIVPQFEDVGHGFFDGLAAVRKGASGEVGIYRQNGHIRNQPSVRCRP